MPVAWGRLGSPNVNSWEGAKPAATWKLQILTTFWMLETVLILVETLQGEKQIFVLSRALNKEEACVLDSVAVLTRLL